MISAFEHLRPCIRTDILFGPALITNEKIIHYVKDLRTQQMYRIGASEYFLMSRMTGTKEIWELSAEYKAAFQMRLSSQAWLQLFTLMHKRAMFAEQASENQLPEQQTGMLAQQSTQVPEGKKVSPSLAKSGPVQRIRRLLFFKPEPLLRRLLPWLGFAFSPFFVYPVLLILGVLEFFCFLHAHEFLVQLASGLHGYLILPLVLLFLVLIGLFLLLHELAHGLACTYFGGSVPEIGLAWTRYMPVVYCKIDDVLLFPHRRQRVFTAFAGIFINLLMLIPFVFLWWWSPASSPGCTVSAFVLLVINLFICFNALPIADLDGYAMLKYALNILDLREQTYRRGFQYLNRLSFKSLKRQVDWSTIPAVLRQPAYMLYIALSFFSLLLFLLGILWCLF